MQLQSRSDASPLSQTQTVIELAGRAGLPEVTPEHHVTIRPRGRWEAPDFAELWANRELLAFLTWRDIKVRYQQTVLGAAWAIIQPLFTMMIFTLFFGRLAKLPSDGIPYPIFAYAGLLPWTFFSNAVTNTGNSLIGSSQLISKVYFPRMLIPGAAVGAGIVDFLIASSILGVLMAVYAVRPTGNLLMLPVLTVMTALLALGVGLWMSALNVKYRDIRYALPFLVQLWMFATPIIYPSSMVPARWRWVLELNPLTGIIEGFRDALFGRAFDWRALGVSAAVTAGVLVFSMFSFRRMEREFADVI